MILITRPTEDIYEVKKKLDSYKILNFIEPLLSIKLAKFNTKKLDGCTLIATSKNALRALSFNKVSKKVHLILMTKKMAEFANSLGFLNAKHFNSFDVSTFKRDILDNLSCSAELIYCSGFEITEDIAKFLSANNFSCKRLVVYRSQRIHRLSDQCIKYFYSGSINSVLLFSGKTAKVFNKLALYHCLNIKKIKFFVLSQKIGCIINASKEQIKCAKNPTLQSMIDCILQYL